MSTVEDRCRDDLGGKSRPRFLGDEISLRIVATDRESSSGEHGDRARRRRGLTNRLRKQRTSTIALARVEDWRRQCFHETRDLHQGAAREATRRWLRYWLHVRRGQQNGHGPVGQRHQAPHHLDRDGFVGTEEAKIPDYLKADKQDALGFRGHSV
jgi:hypothetical protein